MTTIEGDGVSEVGMGGEIFGRYRTAGVQCHLLLLMIPVMAIVYALRLLSPGDCDATRVASTRVAEWLRPIGKTALRRADQCGRETFLIPQGFLPVRAADGG